MFCSASATCVLLENFFFKSAFSYSLNPSDTIWKYLSITPLFTVWSVYRPSYTNGNTASSCTACLTVYWSIILPNLCSVLLSFINRGVPVKAMKQALGMVFCIFMLNVPCCVRCPSSTNTNILLLMSGCSILFTAVSNLLIMVVITASVLRWSIVTKWLPDSAFMTSTPVFLKVPVICLSKSVRSVTNTIKGLLIVLSFAMAFASIAIVSDFPLPCVCHITPPGRALVCNPVICLIAFFTAKYC